MGKNTNPVRMGAVTPLLAVAGVLAAFFLGYVISYGMDVVWPVTRDSQTLGSTNRVKSKDAGNGKASPERQRKEETERGPGGSSREPPSGSGHPVGHLQRLGLHREPSVQHTVLEYMPNAVEFYERFVRTRTPVLLKGAARAMPAFSKWKKMQYLKDKYGDSYLKVEMTKKYRDDNFVKVVMNLTEFLDRFEKEDLYMDTPAGHSPMLRDVTMPACLSCPELFHSIASSHLLFSSGGTSSSFHFDGYDNLLSLISGRKTVILIDTVHQNNCYVDDYKQFQPISPIDPDAVDLEKFPRFKDVPYGVLEMEAGDILYNPAHVSHHVRSYDSPNIAVNIWFDPFRDVYQKFQLQSDLNENEDVSLFNNALQSRIKEVSNSTIQCDPAERNLHSVLKGLDAEDLVYTPDEKSNASMGPFLLNTGHAMPRMGFGSPRVHGKKAYNAYVSALKAGYRMVDSAQLYDEEALGMALQEVGIPRPDLFIISKVHPKNFGVQATLKSIDESLSKLKLDYLDMMLIHTKDCEGFQDCEQGGTWQDAWRGMEEAAVAGKIRSLGVSNFDTVSELEEVMALSSVKVALVQNYMDPYEVPTDVLDYCQQHNITFMSYGTLGRAYVKEMGLSSNPVLTSHVVREAFEPRQCQPAQVVLRWALQRGVAVIPSSEDPTHMAINLQTFDYQLTDEEMANFNTLNRYVTMDGGGSSDDWDSGASAKKPVPKDDGQVSTLNAKVDLTKLSVYAGGEDGHFTAFNGVTGDIMWQYMMSSEFGSSCVFSSDGSVVYVASENHRMYALRVQDGEKLWSFNSGAPFLATPQLSVDKSVVLVGNTIGDFFCLDSKTGDVKWLQELGKHEIWSLPAVGLVDGEELVFMGTKGAGGGMYALRVATGKKKWQRDITDGVWSWPVLSADGRRLIFAGEDGYVYCVDSSSGEDVWTWHRAGKTYSAPLLANGVVYGGSDSGHVHALSAATGSEIWTASVGADIMSSIRISPNGVLVFGVTDNTIRGWNATTGKQIWSLKSGDEVWASAAITQDGTAFIGSIDAHMYAVESDSGKIVWKRKTSLFAASACITPSFQFTPNPII